jgi:hypothetical protein
MLFILVVCRRQARQRKQAHTCHRTFDPSAPIRGLHDFTSRNGFWEFSWIGLGAAPDRRARPVMFEFSARGQGRRSRNRERLESRVRDATGILYQVRGESSQKRFLFQKANNHPLNALLLLSTIFGVLKVTFTVDLRPLAATASQHTARALPIHRPHAIPR